jgi:hypothetical protein
LEDEVEFIVLSAECKVLSLGVSGKWWELVSASWVLNHGLNGLHRFHGFFLMVAFPNLSHLLIISWKPKSPFGGGAGGGPVVYFDYDFFKRKNIPSTHA